MSRLQSIKGSIFKDNTLGDQVYKILISTIAVKYDMKYDSLKARKTKSWQSRSVAFSTYNTAGRLDLGHRSEIKRKVMTGTTKTISCIYHKYKNRDRLT